MRRCCWRAAHCVICFLHAQVLLASGPLCNLGCPEHLKEMDIMQNATPPTKRPPLPRLDIPGAPSGIHVPASTAQNVRNYPMLLSPAARFCVATFGQTLVKPDSLRV